MRHLASDGRYTGAFTGCRLLDPKVYVTSSALIYSDNSRTGWRAIAGPPEISRSTTSTCRRNGAIFAIGEDTRDSHGKSWNRGSAGAISPIPERTSEEVHHSLSRRITAPRRRYVTGLEDDSSGRSSTAASRPCPSASPASGVRRSDPRLCHSLASSRLLFRKYRPDGASGAA